MKNWFASRTFTIGGMILVPALLLWAGYSGWLLLVAGGPWLGLLACLHLMAGKWPSTRVGSNVAAQTARPRRSRVESVLSDRVVLERTMTAILEDIVHSGLEELEESTGRVLARLGSYLGADQCYLFRFSEQPQGMERLVAWQANPKKQLDIPTLIPPEEASQLDEIFQRDSVFLVNDFNLDPHPVSSLQPWSHSSRKAVSGGGVVIHQEEKHLGILGFDVNAPSEWGEDEKKLLLLVANLLSTFFSRIEAHQCQIEAMEALKASSKAKSEFLAKMSHEIRTPLNGVIGMTSLLEDTRLEDEQNKLVNYIKISADHLLMVINDILDFSKIEAGMMVIEEESFNLLQTVEEIRIISASQAEEMGLRLELNVDDRVPANVVGDVVRVRQVLLNLVSNAIKFTGEGRINVRIFPSGSGIKFSVADTGMGICEADQNKIFDQFVQADSSTTRSYGGTGLGLAICRQLVELMGGTIGLWSDEGKGSEFWFELPLEKARASKAKLMLPSANDLKVDADSMPADGLKILLAEDNPINQVFANKLLKLMGAEVTLAENGEEAVARVQEDDFDLVLMDCQMPEVDGYQATARIRELGGHFAELPIIALTAFAGMGDRDKCLTAGMNDYITKPVDRSAILMVIEKWGAANLLMV